MLTNDELKFNKTKEAYEESLQKIREIVDIYENKMKRRYEREDSIITFDDFNEMKKLLYYSEHYGVFRQTIREKDQSVHDSNNANSSGQTTSMDVYSPHPFIAFLIRTFPILERFLNRSADYYTDNNYLDEIEDEITDERSSTDTHGRDVSFFKDEQNSEYVKQAISDVKKAYSELEEISSKLDYRDTLDLDRSPSGTIIDHKFGGPGVTEKYRDYWKEESICKDAVQNSLPYDCLGSKIYLHFLVGNKWVDRDTALKNRHKIKAVRISDNGVGYVPENLLYFFSTKKDDEKSAGEFGEGSKLLSMSSLKLGLGLEFQSRNWTATVVGDDIDIINTRNNDSVDEVLKLNYDINIYDCKPIKGSRTIFHTPTPEFIEYALQLPEKIIPLSGKKPLFITKYGELIDTNRSGEMFVKGIHITNRNAIYSYNFNDAKVTPDRNQFIDFNLEERIYNIIASLDDPEIIKDFLQKLKKYTEEHGLDFDNLLRDGKIELKDDSKYDSSKPLIVEQQLKKIYEKEKENFPIEFLAAKKLLKKFEQENSWGFDETLESKKMQIWKNAFEEVFMDSTSLTPDGEIKQPILKSNYLIRKNSANSVNNNYKVISLPFEWVNCLSKCGIITDLDVLPDYEESTIETSFTTETGKGRWGLEQMIIDAVQNHLPTDSGGNNTFVRFKTKDGQWFDYTQLPLYDNKNIAAIKICDDGIGYDVMNLGLISTNKSNSESAGKWRGRFKNGYSCCFTFGNKNTISIKRLDCYTRKGRSYYR